MNALRYIGPLAALAAAGASCAAGSPSTGDAQWRWPDVPKIVAFGDVHGAYDELASLLAAAGIVDDDLHWAGGETHVVGVGDVIDRGPEPRAVLDLLMRLQEEAAAAGGRFHVVLGNHELMNMTADFRYVSDENFAAFADEEPAGARERALNDYLAAHAGEPEEEARAGFLKDHPPGYFGWRAAFSPGGRYGNWLLGLPLLLVVGDTAFVHGGLPPVVAELGGAGTNRELRGDIRSLLESWHGLIETGIVPRHMDALGAADALAERLENDPESVPADAVAAAEEFIELSYSPAVGEDGPLWYRGTARCHPTLETDVLDDALGRLGVERVVMGHSTTPSRRIVSRMDGRAILIDTGMLESHYHGRPSALVMEGERLSAIYAGEPGPAALLREHSNVAYRFGDVDALEQQLREGEVTENEAAPDRRYRLVTLTSEDGELPARFTAARDFEHEVAAYRLARELKLGFVPPAVLREIDGEEGALSAWSGDLESEAARKEDPFERPTRCAVGDDYQLMYVFDALIRNLGRTNDSIRYTGPLKRLWLADHLDTFDTGSEVPDYLRDIDAVVPPALRDRLAALDEDGLQELLDELLSRRQIRAILERRDEILELWPAPADADAARSAAA